MSSQEPIQIARNNLANPNLSPDELYAIVQDFPELTGEAAQHPNAYPELREWAAQDGGAQPGAGGPVGEQKSRKALWWSLGGVAGVLVLALVAWLVVVPLLGDSGKDEVLALVDDQNEARRGVLDARDNAIATLNDVLDRTDEYQGLTYLDVEDTDESREQIATVAADPDTYFSLVETVTRVEEEIPAEAPTKQQIEDQSREERETTREELKTAIAICTGLLDDLTLGIDEVTAAVEEKSRGNAEAALQEAIEAGEGAYSESEGQVEDESLRDTLRQLLDDGAALLNDPEIPLDDLDTKREEITAQTETVREASLPTFESMLGAYEDASIAWNLAAEGLEFVKYVCTQCGGRPDPIERFVSGPTWNGSCFVGTIYGANFGITNTLEVCPAGRGGPGDDSRDRLFRIFAENQGSSAAYDYPAYRTG